MKYCVLLSLLLVCFTSCGTGEKEVKETYNNYKFDQLVIDKLPLYDSLVSAIIKNFSAFEKFIKDKDSYRSFRYMPTSDDPDVFIKLPPTAAPEITPHFERIGKEFIYGFDVFKDSSIKIHVRATQVKQSEVDIFESLSYYYGGNIRDRVFPEKDTTLNKYWQYWVRINKKPLF